MTTTPNLSDATPDFTDARPIDLVLAIRAGRAAQAEMDRRTVAREAAAAERKVRDEAEAKFRYENSMSTETLQAHLTNPDAAPGDRNTAPQLLRLDTIEQRHRAVAVAHTHGNLQGGRWSENVYAAVNMLLTLIAAGTPDAETYPERTAREYREREQSIRAANMAQQAAIYRHTVGATR